MSCVIVAMTLRKISILGMNGHLLDLEMPCENVSCWDVMRAIKSEIHVPKSEQKICLDGTILMPRSEIPDGVDLELTLMRVIPTCAHCERTQNEQRPLLLCSSCVHVAYCDEACQKLDWSKHRMICKRSVTTVTSVAIP